jgi:FKBP-type peptidyl-prolyl cis-trans isomerase
MLIVCALSFSGVHADDLNLDSDDKKTLYALGLAMSQQLKSFRFSAEETQIVQQGLRDGLLGGETQVTLDTYGPKIDPYLQSRLGSVTDNVKAEGKEFRERMAQESGAAVTESGLVYVEQQAGTGPSPSSTATVKVHYHGTFSDGTVFDSSMGSDEPATFALNAVVPCFSEGIQKMSVGGKSKLVCPPDLAYGDQGYPPMIPPGATLIFEIELLEIVTADAAVAPAPPPAP